MDEEDNKINVDLLEKLQEVYDIDSLAFCQQYIKVLESRIKELKVKSTFIKVSERYPDIEDHYLTINAYAEFEIQWWELGEESWTKKAWELDRVMAWMPVELPGFFLEDNDDNQPNPSAS